MSQQALGPARLVDRQCLWQQLRTPRLHLSSSSRNGRPSSPGAEGSAICGACCAATAAGGGAMASRLSSCCGSCSIGRAAAGAAADTAAAAACDAAAAAPASSSADVLPALPAVAAMGTMSPGGADLALVSMACVSGRRMAEPDTPANPVDTILRC